MRCQISRWSRYAVVGVVVSSMATTGCGTSGWKMPTPKMFSWSKKPSETTLAGSGPSSLTYPTSPAQKQQPHAIASAAAGNSNSSTASANTQRFVPANSTASYTPPGTAPSSYTPPSLGGPSSGPNGAASANGFVTGPYNTNSQAGAASSLANNGIAPRTGPGFSNASYPTNLQSPNSFAPTGQMASTSIPNARPGAAGPNGYAVQPVSTAPAGFGAPPQTPTNFGTPTQPAGFAQNNPYAPPANANPAFPSQPGGQFSPQSTIAGSTGYTPVGFNPQPTTGAATTASWPATGQANTQVPTQPAGFNTPTATTYGAAPYKPGSTGRPTNNYNFSQPSNTGIAGAAPSGFPTPSTASGTSSPGFAPPPSSTYNR